MFRLAVNTQNSLTTAQLLKNLSNHAKYPIATAKHCSTSAATRAMTSIQIKKTTQ